MKLACIFSILFLHTISSSPAQDSPASKANDLSKLHFMVGEWQGNGWMMTQSGKEYAQITEKVECKLDCHLLVVNGLGVATDSSTMETRVVHEAFGVIFHDQKSNTHKIRAYKSDNVNETELEHLEDRVVRWTLTVPGRGTVRFTVDFTEENNWKEVGEFSSDGENWIRILEMELVRVRKGKERKGKEIK